MALIAFFGGVFLFAFLFMFVKTKIREKNAGKILSEQEEFFSMIRSKKRKEIERIPVDHSRLLDAITEPYQDKQRRRAISYTTEIEKG